MTTKKIIFVCLGNICRSPLAEAVFKSKIEEISSSSYSSLEIESAATSDWNLGDGADERAVQVALKHRYHSIKSHRARKLAAEHFIHNGEVLIICMDRSNVQNVHKIIHQHSNTKCSVHLFSDFGPEKGAEVPDPYYGGIEDFERVLIQCEKYSDDLINFLHN